MRTTLLMKVKIWHWRMVVMVQIYAIWTGYDVVEGFSLEYMIFHPTEAIGMFSLDSLLFVTLDLLPEPQNSGTMIPFL